MPPAAPDDFCYGGLPAPHLQEYVETVVREKGFRKPRYAVRPGARVGDNYASVLYRVEVTDEEDSSRSLSLMVKSCVQSATVREALRLYQAFTNEANMYNVVLSTYAEMLREKGLLAEGASYPDTPRCYLAAVGDGSADADQDALVLQDMRPEGFVLRARRRGLDAPHCRLALRALARLHAHSLAAEALRPEQFQRLRLSLRELYQKDADGMKLFDKETLTKNTLEMIEKRFPPGSREYEKAKEYTAVIREDILNLVAPCPDGGNVITQGDCWIGNLLFRYLEGGAVDRVCLLDFQLARYASPALDLAHVLFCSTEKAMRDAHLDALLGEYHAELLARMRLLGVRDPEAVFSWRHLQDHLRRYGRFGFVMGIIVIPVCMAEQDAVPNLCAELERGGNAGTAFTVKCKDSRERDERVADLLQDMVERGYL